MQRTRMAGGHSSRAPTCSPESPSSQSATHWKTDPQRSPSAPWQSLRSNEPPARPHPRTYRTPHTPPAQSSRRTTSPSAAHRSTSRRPASKTPRHPPLYRASLSTSPKSLAWPSSSPFPQLRMPPPAVATASQTGWRPNYAPKSLACERRSHRHRGRRGCDAGHGPVPEARLRRAEGRRKTKEARPGRISMAHRQRAGATGDERGVRGFHRETGPQDRRSRRPHHTQRLPQSRRERRPLQLRHADGRLLLRHSRVLPRSHHRSWHRLRHRALLRRRRNRSPGLPPLRPANRDPHRKSPATLGRPHRLRQHPRTRPQPPPSSYLTAKPFASNNTIVILSEGARLCEPQPKNPPSRPHHPYRSTRSTATAPFYPQQ